MTVGILIALSTILGVLFYAKNKTKSIPSVHDDNHTTVDAEGNEFFDGYKVYDYTGVQFEDVNIYLN